MFRTFSIQNWNSISKDKYQSRLSDFKFKGFNLFFKKVEYQNLSVTDENISLEYKIHWNIIFWLLFIIAALATKSDEIFTTSSVYGFLAIILAAINIFGGFLVTQRMLAMYKKKQKDK